MTPTNPDERLLDLLWNTSKPDPDHPDRVQTGYGTKTKIGLLATIRDILDPTGGRGLHAPRTAARDEQLGIFQLEIRLGNDAFRDWQPGHESPEVVRILHDLADRLTRDGLPHPDEALPLTDYNGNRVGEAGTG